MNYKYIGLLIITLFSVSIFTLTDNVNAKTYYPVDDKFIPVDGYRT